MHIRFPKVEVAELVALFMLLCFLKYGVGIEDTVVTFTVTAAAFIIGYYIIKNIIVYYRKGRGADN